MVYVHDGTQRKERRGGSQIIIVIKKALLMLYMCRRCERGCGEEVKHRRRLDLVR